MYSAMPLGLDLPIVAAVAALLIWLVYGRRMLLRNKYKQPPNLPQRFFSGMAHSPEIQGPEVPRTYLRWAKEYGTALFVYRGVCI